MKTLHKQKHHDRHHIELRSSLCLMWKYTRFEQWRDSATTKFSLHSHNEGILNL